MNVYPEVRDWWLKMCDFDHQVKRIESFYYLQNEAKIKTVPWGYLKNQSTSNSGLVVVYHHPNLHAGGGKELIELKIAKQAFYGKLYSEYVVPDVKGESLRLLTIGDKQWWIKYRSFDDWRSNCGDGETEVLSRHLNGREFYPQIDLPIYGIDFVVSGGIQYALEINLAPGIQTTGIERDLDGFTITSELVSYHKKTGLEFWKDTKGLINR